MKTGLEFAIGLFDNGLDAMAVLDDNLCAVYWNAAMEDLSSVSSERAVGTSVRDLFPMTYENAARLLRRSLTGECLVADTPFFAARDPVVAKECDWFCMPLTVDGAIIGCIVVVQQLAARFDLEDRIREVEYRFRSMADSSPVLLWMAGTDGLCNFFNNSWLEFTGRRLEQELGLGWAEGVHPEDFRLCMDTYMDAFTAQEPFEMEYRLRRRDSEYRWILDRGTPRYLESGVFAGYIGSCIDITERREAEQNQKIVTTDLKHANEYMEQLLYAASHDLQEPIRMVTAFLDLLQESITVPLDKEQQSYIQYARDGAKRMKSLVAGLLELSRTRARTPELHEVDSNSILSEALQDLEPTIQDAAAVLNIGTLPQIRADPVLFRSLFQNLLSNAIKFRGERSPRIAVNARRNANEWIFSVRDNGIGFESEYVETVFETFRRLHNREQYPGNGLGLALAREIVTRHGGRIWAQSVAGEGTEIQFALPIRT